MTLTTRSPRCARRSITLIADYVASGKSLEQAKKDVTSAANAFETKLSCFAGFAFVDSRREEETKEPEARGRRGVCHGPRALPVEGCCCCCSAREHECCCYRSFVCAPSAAVDEPADASSPRSPSDAVRS